ncbi:MAG TPA: TetR/AcrR family transcriptional regulator [Spirochaetes bacterium]|nr:TetR/AcrR family transcriptional regulator [Spirochaetota bacterium]
MEKKVPREKTTARKPVQDRGIKTKAAIIDAAKILFGEKGFHGTNSKEIAAKAGVATGTFYSYFDEKKPVFFEVIRNYYREISEKVLADGALEIYNMPVRDKAGLKKMIHELIHALYKAHTLSPELHREITAMIYSDPEIETLIKEEENKTVVLVRALLLKVSKRLAVNDVEAAVEVVLRSAEELIHRLRMFDNEISDERILNELEDMIYRYLFMKE